MKNIILISILVFLLQACSSNDNNTVDSGVNNNTNSTLVYDKTGYSYETVKICNQIWTKKNLNTLHYRNGDLIPQVTDPIQWAKLTTGAWCYYNNDPTNATNYGKLYNWYAVNDPRGITPVGWHVPTETEVQSMIDCLGGWQVAGGKMKSTRSWSSPNLGANNSSGFTAISIGMRNSTCPGSTTPSASFSILGHYASWWTSTGQDLTNAAAYTNNYNLTSCYTYGTCKTSGFSIRCVKD